MHPRESDPSAPGANRDLERWEERARAAEAEVAATRWELMISREASYALRRQLERELARRLRYRLSRLLGRLPGKRLRRS